MANLTPETTPRGKSQQFQWDIVMVQAAFLDLKVEQQRLTFFKVIQDMAEPFQTVLCLHSDKDKQDERHFMQQVAQNLHPAHTAYSTECFQVNFKSM